MNAVASLVPPEHPQPVTDGDDLQAQARAWIEHQPSLPRPGSGDTLVRWQALAHIAARDLCLAKVLEAHYDAQAILEELGATAPDRDRLGAVWAAEGPAATLRFDRASGTLSGDKPWCSGAGWVDHALVTVRDDGRSRLFLVPVRRANVSFLPQTWQATGMGRVPSGTARFDQVPAVEVGAADGYLQRPGFWHGGAGIAACWFGGASALAEPLLRSARADEPGMASGLLGEIDLALSPCASLLRELATLIDAQPGLPHQREIVRARSAVERAASLTLDRVGRALGPGPMCMDPAHARRWADLTVFIRQSHADRDWQHLGNLMHREGRTWTL